MFTPSLSGDTSKGFQKSQMWLVGVFGYVSFWDTFKEEMLYEASWKLNFSGVAVHLNIGAQNH